MYRLYYFKETQNSNDVLSMVLLISSKVFHPRYLSFKKTFN